jgi:aminoglycoside phosphotransferase family enzyme
VVDWLVQMRRLPTRLRLDVALRRGEADRTRLGDAFARLAAFCRTAAPAGLPPDAYLARLAAVIETNEAALRPWRGRLPPGLPERLAAGQRAALARLRPPLAARAGRVVEAHGDLRPEHVYLGRPPVIVDRLEFDLRLRQLDPVDELAFLAMECDRLGAPWVGADAFAALADSIGGQPDQRLVPFHKSLRAAMRARLALGHLADPAAPGPSPWLAQAIACLALAASYLQRLEAAG